MAAWKSGVWALRQCQRVVVWLCERWKNWSRLSQRDLVACEEKKWDRPLYSGILIIDNQSSGVLFGVLSSVLYLLVVFRQTKSPAFAGLFVCFSPPLSADRAIMIRKRRGCHPFLLPQKRFQSAVRAPGDPFRSKSPPGRPAQSIRCRPSVALSAVGFSTFERTKRNSRKTNKRFERKRCKYDKKSNLLVDTIVSYDKVVMDKADVDFFTNLVEKGIV